MKRAVALRYDEEADAAPCVVSTGDGWMADRIEQAARDYGIPVVVDVPLSTALAQLTVGDQIPEALYEAVATLLNELSVAPHD